MMADYGSREQWLERVYEDPQHSYVGRYCCPVAAFAGAAFCAAHADAEPSEVLVAHGLEPTDLREPEYIAPHEAASRLR